MPNCPDCERPFKGARCQRCGWQGPAEGQGPDRRPRAVCDCGASLFASGLCAAAGGYPATSSCPLACPICRGLLGWDGGCERCHGCTSGKREDWTSPGDRYELDKGHWQRVDGPRQACTPAENVVGFAAIRAILGAGGATAGRGTRLPPVDPAIRARLARR